MTAEQARQLQQGDKLQHPSYRGTQAVGAKLLKALVVANVWKSRLHPDIVRIQLKGNGDTWLDALEFELYDTK